MSSQSMENFLSKDKNQIQNRIGRLSTRVWLNEVSKEHGLSPTTLKSEKSPLKTDYLSFELGKIVPEHHTERIIPINTLNIVGARSIWQNPD
jgi:hypothetical protein